ncbi:L-serine ammonia-lyase, iron-sulfur-dependent, subunit alpha [Bacillus salipaludis]|uniref:L-serine dehydratase n=1 Tax=Bacillus salipaludis TaxID=2547811 RepID=A0A4R5VI97_9BACI|nr:L-serine ammonia-lyase, iron-sulfur-dependent, subunit alpha [Bacillus salipaludis]MDQ6599058.1 L-serine ammonia-lyase, iron-sulfur-dependent, subunit alpha [Bacillus salipaludis]TDK54250.1 L-serine ammonia-lyase, iron-sulfur-dependent, subunit alpha [Bacillus salipaludis]
MSFMSLRELIELAEQQSITIAELMIQTEIQQKNISREAIIEKMAEQFTVMEEAVRKGTTSAVMSRTGLTGGDGYRLHQYAENGKSFINPVTLNAAANALAVSEVNAAMGRIVATPTAGSAGILPAVLVHALDSGTFPREQIVLSMFTASALGLVIANKASISGAAGGCQAEIGSATAMAAGTLVELAGGTPEQVGNAIGIALKNSLGLVCDPVAGLVEIPCIVRNGLHAITAQAAADMALAGVVSIIPPDEVIHVMHEVGQQMPESLRETGIGGLAGTPTGQKLKAQIFSETTSSCGPAKYQSAYEIIGPVMVGPSSSHTAGAVRIGNIACQLLNEKPLFAKFSLMGSFAETYQGHGTDLALLGGVLGLTTMNEGIPNANSIAEENGLQFEFTKRVLGSYHPNTVLVELLGATRRVKVLASSLGGGKVEVQELDDYPLKFSGERPTLVIRHSDRKGVIAELSGSLYQKGLNIARMANERSKINGSAITVCEIDNQIEGNLLTILNKEIPIIDEILLIQTM